MSYCKKCYLEKVNASARLENIVYGQEEGVCECCGEKRLLVDHYEDDPDVMTIDECRCETQKHIEQVRKYIKFITDKLTQRGIDHDASKLQSPEVEIFAKFTPKLAHLTFGSEEYNKCLEEMSVALKHHYSQNAHHPEHWPNGINDMSLIDLVEAICDWTASSKRQNDGNILQTIDVLAERFGITKQLKQVIINTVKLFEDVK